MLSQKTISEYCRASAFASGLVVDDLYLTGVMDDHHELPSDRGPSTMRVGRPVGCPSPA